MMTETRIGGPGHYTPTDRLGARGSGRERAWCVVGAAPGVVGFSWLNAVRCGSPLASGSGSAQTLLFALGHVAPNAARGQAFGALDWPAQAQVDYGSPCPTLRRGGSRALRRVCASRQSRFADFLKEIAASLQRLTASVRDPYSGWVRRGPPDIF